MSKPSLATQQQTTMMDSKALVSMNPVGRPIAANYRSMRAGWLLLVALVCVTTLGCGKKTPDVVPVEGKVTYNGEPMPFGSVTFQPAQGQPAKANIESDGTFTLSTYRPGDGAVPGKHKVRVACYTSQDESRPKPPGEQTLGELLIPSKYTMFDTSGFEVEVQAGTNEPVLLELTGPPQKFGR